MCRGMVSVNEVKEVEEAYNLCLDKFSVIRIKNKLNSPLQNVSLNVLYPVNMPSIIGEIQIKFGSKSILYNANHFIYELARCDSFVQF